MGQRCPGADMAGKDTRVSHLDRGAAKIARRAVTHLEKAILTREEWLRLAAEGSELGLWYWDEVRQSLFWDRKTREIFGASLQGDVYVDTFYSALHPDDAARVRQAWRSQLESGIPCELEYRARRPDGSVRWIQARGSGYCDNSGKPLYMIGVVFDVTERKQSEQERVELTARLINAQEDEQTRLAMELHDDICQKITVVAVNLRTVASLIKDDEARTLLEETIRATSTLGEDIQSLSHRMHPRTLELLGLVGGIKSLCQELAPEDAIHIEFDYVDVPSQLPAGTALALFRIVQEALHNVIKHSGASRAEVSLKGDPAGISLMIFDNGVGIEHTAELSQGVGVWGMQERARMLDGIFRIQSRPEIDGTRIVVVVPHSTSVADGCDVPVRRLS